MLVSFLFHVASGQRRPLGAWGDSTSLRVSDGPLGRGATLIGSLGSLKRFLSFCSATT